MTNIALQRLMYDYNRAAKVNVLILVVMLAWVPKNVFNKDNVYIVIL